MTGVQTCALPICTAAAPPPCQGGEASIAGAWGGARRTTANAFLAGLDGDYARESVPRIVAALDRYADDWVVIQRASCMAHQRGEVSSAAFDRRTACLARRKAALTAVADVATSATVSSLPDLVIASSGLPDLATCDDDDALLSPVAPPTAAEAPEAAAIADLIAKVDVERDAARTEQATRDAESAVARAEALGYQPLVARALLARGRIALSLRTSDRGAADFDEATRTAMEAGDERLAIESFARSAFAIATTVGPADALAGLPLIESITRRLGDRAAFERALLHHNAGVVDMARGDRAAARTAFTRALAESQSLSGAARIEMTVALSNLALVATDEAERTRVGDELIAVNTRLLGPNHPATIAARILLAGLTMDPPAAYRALAAPCRTMAALHPTQVGWIAECSYELLLLALAMADATTMRLAVDQIAATGDHGGDADYLRRAAGVRAMLDGQPLEAARTLDTLHVTVAPGTPWFVVSLNVDLDLLAAAARLGAGQARAASLQLDGAGQQLDAVAAQMPPSVLASRRFTLAALRARASRP